ncbi:DUF882 domain-containing protein, partial [Leptospira bourretii]|uniref:polymorphic toxin-type HINT domain-containing protein n=1 Tax=Leptospira bourretii TaxID=2484962 RepID=UPI001091000B
ASVAAVIAAPFTAGASLIALAAYKTVKGAYEGGVLGALAGAVSAYSSITGVDVSYSYDEGFGANVGVKMGAVSLGVSYSESAGFGASASVKLGGLSAGVSYTQNGGFGASVGYEFGGNNDVLKGLGVNLSYSQSGGFSGGVSYSKATEGGTKVTGGLNYSKDTGVGASLNAQKEVSRNDNYATTLTGGVSFSQKQGFGASLDASIEKVAAKTLPGQTPPPKPQFQSFSQMDMGLSFNQKEGFSASLGFDGINALSYNQNTGLSGNTNFAMDFRKKQIQDEIDAETKARKEAADKKLEGAKQEWLKEKRKDPNYANIKDDDALLAQYKKEQEAKAEKDGSRDNILEKIGGDIYDDVAGALGISTSDAGRLDKDGKFVPRTCFVAGTKVHTKDGLKNIEDIRVGDVVLSWNETTGEREYKVVTELFLHEINQLYEVKTTKGATLETTWNHPFWVVDRKEWVEVKDLQVGDVLALADGALVEISHIRSYYVEPTKVYNFEVEDNHSYYVGEDGVLVHNYTPLTGPNINFASGLIKYVKSGIAKIFGDEEKDKKAVSASESKKSVPTPSEDKNLITREKNGEIVANLRVNSGVTIKSEVMKEKLLDFSEELDGREVRVVSGYRSQAKQDKLRKDSSTKGRAAKKSQHTYGDAVDISVSGYTKDQTWLAAYDSGLFMRVSRYRTSEKVHVDNQTGVTTPQLFITNKNEKWVSVKRKDY